MTDRTGGRPVRRYAASRFDETTLAAFSVLLLVTVAAVLIVGMATAEERIGCGLNDLSLIPGRLAPRHAAAA